MPTKYVIEADNIQEVYENTGEEVEGRVRVALSRPTRIEALEAADVLLSAFGENTEITLRWEFCPHDNVPKSTFGNND